MRSPLHNSLCFWELQGVRGRRAAAQTSAFANAYKPVVDQTAFVGFHKPQAVAHIEQMSAARAGELVHRRSHLGVVKIRKGMAARLIFDTQRGHGAVLKWFRHFGEHILDRVDDCHATSSDKWRLIAAATRVVASTPEPPPG